MATTYIWQSGQRSVDYTPGSAVSAGDVVVQSGLVGVAENDIAASAKGSLQIDAVIKAPKTTGTSTAIAAGDRVYWDATNSVMTENDDGTTAAGVAVVAAADADSWVYVLLIPGCYFT